MKKGKIKYLVFSVLILITVLLFTGFTERNKVQENENVMKNVEPKKMSAEIKDDVVNKNFIVSNADFSVNLFKNTIEKGKNSVISPLSVGISLGMTQNGAAGNTLKQFENILGGNLTSDEINRNYRNIWNRIGKTDDGKLKITEDGRCENIEGGKLNIANSIWLNENISSINKRFLNKNSEFYNADIFKLDFSDANSVNKINNWVKDKTDWKINKIVNNIDNNSIMFLINSINFEDGWLDEYKENDIKTGGFRAQKTVSVTFMSSYEKYIHDDKADGIIKPFKDKDFAFAAILPKENNLENYINQMTGESLFKLLNSATDEKAYSSLPKFKYEYKADLNIPLKEMGITDAFDINADFSNLAKTKSGNLYLKDVLHKAFIQIDETGARAGAATKAEIALTCAQITQKKVIFNRPFIYTIFDTKTELPIFIGTVYDTSK